MKRMNLSFVLRFLLFFSCLFGCHPNLQVDRNELKLIQDAYQSGNLTVVEAILRDRKKERGLSLEETKLFLKSLFYLNEWEDFFSEWEKTNEKPPELVLYYFKAILSSKVKREATASEINDLLVLLPVSPEACLLYLRSNDSKITKFQKQILLAQSKQFQTYLDILQKELHSKP